jgi:hypothetical protein
MGSQNDDTSEARPVDRVGSEESTFHHHYELNYTPPQTQSGRRFARR